MTCTEASFLRDVKDHVLEVIRDDGVYRHIRLRKPHTSCYHFDLITWPGYLCYCGDMGTYVFERATDMFGFFRSHRRDFPERGLPINPRYWSEKLVSTDCNGQHPGSAIEFDPEKFTRVINEYRISWMRSLKQRGATKAQRRDLWEEVDHGILGVLDSSDRAQIAAYDFVSTVKVRRHGDGWAPHDFEYEYSFVDLFEHHFTRYTTHFIWCCYALAWGIQKYDDAKADLAAKEVA